MNILENLEEYIGIIKRKEGKMKLYKIIQIKEFEVISDSKERAIIECKNGKGKNTGEEWR